MLYDFLTHGRREGPEAFLKQYHGYLQCDAHSVYDQIFAPLDAARIAPIEVGCWAHGRRKFYDSREQNKEAFVVLDMIGGLYKLERKLKKTTSEERYLSRQQYAVPILNNIFSWCHEHHNKFLPKAPLSGAIQYAINAAAPATIGAEALVPLPIAKPKFAPVSKSDVYILLPGAAKSTDTAP